MVEASQGAPLASFRPATVFPFLGSDYPSGKDLGWIDDVSDKLTMHIALHEFEDAIALIEKAKSIFTIISANPLAEQLLRSKVEQRSNEVSTVLLATLSDTSIRKTGVVRTSGWLMRLGQGERARETFLAGRGELLKQRTGEISFTSQNAGYAAGNEAAAAQALVEEVAQLSFVCFTLIRNTCEWYMAAYKDHQTASCEFALAMDSETHANMGHVQPLSAGQARRSICLLKSSDDTSIARLQETSIPLARAARLRRLKHKWYVPLCQRALCDRLTAFRHHSSRMWD